jgi:hypothetical protein
MAEKGATLDSRELPDILYDILLRAIPAKSLPRQGPRQSAKPSDRVRRGVHRPYSVAGRGEAGKDGPYRL